MNFFVIISSKSIFKCIPTTTTRTVIQLMDYNFWLITWNFPCSQVSHCWIFPVQNFRQKFNGNLNLRMRFWLICPCFGEILRLFARIYIKFCMRKSHFQQTNFLYAFLYCTFNIRGGKSNIRSSQYFMILSMKWFEIAVCVITTRSILSRNCASIECIFNGITWIRMLE